MKATATIVGRLTRDCTSVFKNADGTAKRVLFSVACNSVYKGKDNQKVKTTDFIPCIAWDPHASLLEEWGLKGRLVLIKGTVETFQKGPDENGEYEPTRVQVRVSQIEFLGFEDNVRSKFESSKLSPGNDILTALSQLLGIKEPKKETQPANPLVDALTQLLADNKKEPAKTEPQTVNPLIEALMNLGKAVEKKETPKPAPTKQEELTAALINIINAKEKANPEKQAPQESPEVNLEALQGLI